MINSQKRQAIIEPESKTSIDLRSDTVTEMSAGMRHAMSHAVAGDMLYEMDDNVIALEEILAKLFEMNAMWVPSCTMANLIGLLLSRRSLGCEIIVGETSHINTFERKNASFVGGMSYRTLPDRHGCIQLDDLRSALVAESAFFPEQAAIALENTHNLSGGNAFNVEYFEEICGWARSNQLRVHLDGARIFNASVALNVRLASWSFSGGGPDTLAVSLSKGLGTPAGGALLIQSPDDLERAKYIRKALGGTMHTGVGYLAAAAVEAIGPTGINASLDQLARDHYLAEWLSDGIRAIDGFSVLNGVQTNIIYFEHSTIVGPELALLLKQRGVLSTCLSTSGVFPTDSYIKAKAPVRFVTHRGITKSNAESILYALQRIAPFPSSSISSA